MVLPQNVLNTNYGFKILINKKWFKNKFSFINHRKDHELDFNFTKRFDNLRIVFFF